MKLAPRQNESGWVASLGRPTVDFLRAARDRVRFQEDLRLGQAEMLTREGGDVPGLLSSTLAMLNGSAEGDPPSRSIRSLLSASLGGRYSLFVATDRTDQPDRLPEIEGLRTLRSTNISQFIDRSPVLEGREFVELALEVPPALEQRRLLLTAVVRIGVDLHLPIGHIHFPLTDLEGARLRVGVGIPVDDQVMEIAVVEAARRVANEIGCGLDVRSRSLRGWETLRAVCLEDERQVQPAMQRWEVDLIAEARVGRMSELLQQLDERGTPASHAVMSVLESCTVARVGGFSDLDRPALLDALKWASDPLGSDSLSAACWISPEPVALPEFNWVSRGASAIEPLWVGWRCRDVPGGLSQVLAALSYPLGPEYNITYVASRMTQGGEVNAGKLRAIPTIDLSIEQRFDAMQEAVREGEPLPAPLVVDIAEDEAGLRHREGRVALL